MGSRKEGFKHTCWSHKLIEASNACLNIFYNELGSDPEKRVMLVGRELFEGIIVLRMVVAIKLNRVALVFTSNEQAHECLLLLTARQAPETGKLVLFEKEKNNKNIYVYIFN